jgi:hypothetical protein
LKEIQETKIVILFRTDPDEALRRLLLIGDSNLHGVLASLKARPNGNLRFEIIPPEWNKHYNKEVFGKLWTAASTRKPPSSEFGFSRRWVSPDDQ